MWDELPSGREHRRDPRRWGRFITEASAATAAVLLSLAVFSLNGFYALRGSEIVVLPPERVLLYRSGEGDRSLLAVALPARLINTASQDYGDVLVSASIELQGGDGRMLSFPWTPWWSRYSPWTPRPRRRIAITACAAFNLREPELRSGMSSF